MRVQPVKLDKSDFVALLEYASNLQTLRFSMDPEGGLWPSYDKGYTKKPERLYVEEVPLLLGKVAEIHTNERPGGGRFGIDFQGVRSFESNRYFILWEKSKELQKFERSVPIESDNMLDLWAMMAKPRR